MIRIKIKDIEMTLEEAEQLYQELRQMFDKQQQPIYPIYPVTPKYPWWQPFYSYTTCINDMEPATPGANVNQAQLDEIWEARRET